MKIAAMVLVAMMCVAGTSFAARNFLIDDLQGTFSGGPDGTVDYGAGNGSRVEIYADTNITELGSESLRIEYKAVSGGYIYVARGWDLYAKRAVWLVRPQDIRWDDYKAISFYVYGSNSGVRIAFGIRDNQGQLWRFIFVDDFTGWKQIVCPFEEFRANGQQGDSDIDFPVKSYQIEPLPESEGVFYFDHVELISKEE